jgi:hypothetical protein
MNFQCGMNQPSSKKISSKFVNFDETMNNNADLLTNSENELERLNSNTANTSNNKLFGNNSGFKKRSRVHKRLRKLKTPKRCGRLYSLAQKKILARKEMEETVVNIPVH